MAAFQPQAFEPTFGPTEFRRKEQTCDARIRVGMRLPSNGDTTPMQAALTPEQRVSSLIRVLESVANRDRRARMQALHLMLDAAKKLKCADERSIDLLFAAIHPQRVHPAVPETILLATRFGKPSIARDALLTRFLAQLGALGEPAAEIEGTRQRLQLER